MTYNTKAAVLITALAALLTFGYATRTAGEPTGEIGTATSTVATTTADHIPDAGKMVRPQLSDEQQAWIDALEQCESRGDPEAVNPKDRDGTPSYGAFQFKPSTFAFYARAYRIATTSAGYMDRDVQRAIVERMVQDPTTVWHQQFPDCSRKLGLPPQG